MKVKSLSLFRSWLKISLLFNSNFPFLFVWILKFLLFVRTRAGTRPLTALTCRSPAVLNPTVNSTTCSVYFYIWLIFAVTFKTFLKKTFLNFGEVLKILQEAGARLRVDDLREMM